MKEAKHWRTAQEEKMMKRLKETDDGILIEDMLISLRCLEAFMPGSKQYDWHANRVDWISNHLGISQHEGN